MFFIGFDFNYDVVFIHAMCVLCNMLALHILLDRLISEVREEVLQFSYIGPDVGFVFLLPSGKLLSNINVCIPPTATFCEVHCAASWYEIHYIKSE